MIPADAVSDLVPFAHVADVDRSVAFYERLGFEMRDEFVPEDRRVWAFLERGDARLMVAEAEEAIEPRAQAVLFYLYTRDLDGLRARLVSEGVPAGEISTGNLGPDRQMDVVDPDGYVLMLAEIEGERVGRLRAGVGRVATGPLGGGGVGWSRAEVQSGEGVRPRWSDSGAGGRTRGGSAPYFGVNPPRPPHAAATDAPADRDTPARTPHEERESFLSHW